MPGFLSIFKRGQQRKNKPFFLLGIFFEEKKLIPIEVKLRFLNKKLSGLKYFMDKYKVKSGYACVLRKGKDLNSNKKIMPIYPWQLSSI